MDSLALIRGGPAPEPSLEPAIARALLGAVASGRSGPVLRVYRPAPAVAFGRRDALAAGFREAARAVAARGFEPVVRPQGGHAAAYHEDCLVIDEAFPSQDAMSGIQARFAAVAERHVRALRRLGVDARVGEVPGEYCPGAFTVNARGAVKLVGGAQRVVRGGWLLSSVIVVSGASALREVLSVAYDALALSWDPRTVGAAGEEAPVGPADVEEALLAAYREDYGVVEAELPAAVLAEAVTSAGRYRAQP